MLNETKLVTRYVETDQMGVIYHSNYFVYFEVGRTDFLKNYGMNYKDMENMDIILPVIEVNCKYKVSAKYADELIVKTTITKLSPTRITFKYDLVREVDGVLLAEGFTEHVFVSKESGKPMNMKRMHGEVYEKLEKLM